MIDYKQKMFALAREWLEKTCYLEPGGKVRQHYSAEENEMFDNSLDDLAAAMLRNGYAKIARYYEAIGEDMRHVAQDELDGFAFRLMAKTMELNEKQNEGGGITR